MADSGHPERSLPTIVSRYVMDILARVIPLWIIRHRAGVAAHDKYGRMAEVVGALARGYYNRGGNVGFLAAVQQAERLYHPARAMVIFHRNWRAVDSFGVEACMEPVRNRDFAKGIGGASGIMQITHRAHTETLR